MGHEIIQASLPRCAAGQCFFRKGEPERHMCEVGDGNVELDFSRDHPRALRLTVPTAREKK